MNIIMKLDEIEYRKISEIKKELLYDFYNKAFPLRSEILFKNWKWISRYSLNKKEPLVAIYQKKVIAHAGLISTQIYHKQNKHNAIWFIDFFILPEFRNLGVGKSLTNKWMELEGNQFTFCNRDSLKVFKKLDWEQDTNFYKTCKVINPLKWIPFIKTLDQDILKKLNFLNLFNRSIYSKNVSFINLLDFKKNFLDLINLKNINYGENLKPFIIKDKSWAEWRILESPFIKHYHLFLIETSYVVVSINFDNNKKKLNIIHSNFENDNYKSIILNSVMNWSINNNVDIIWLSLNKTSDIKNLEKFFNLKFNLIFACNSYKSSLEKNELRSIVNLEGIDSDLEILNYNNNFY